MTLNFSITFHFTTILVFYIFSISILSYPLLLNCDYFHYVNSPVELRKVKRIYWDDCKVVGREKRGEGIIMNLGSCLKKYLRKNELSEEVVTERRELVSMVRAWSPWGESGMWTEVLGLFYMLTAKYSYGHRMACLPLDSYWGRRVRLREGWVSILEKVCHLTGSIVFKFPIYILSFCIKNFYIFSFLFKTIAYKSLHILACCAFLSLSIVSLTLNVRQPCYLTQCV